MMLCLAIAIAGFPGLASAKAQCPMMSTMQISSMQDMQKAKPCARCAQTAKQEHQKRNGCCGDIACAAKCSSMSNANTLFFGSNQITSLSLVGTSMERFCGSDHVLASHLFHTQDRPPKHLS